jgi:N-acetylglutamate synthase-like GNAT family acetyltransferase
MYIHDVAVHPDARGLGVADLLLENLQLVASDTSISERRLVSVQGSRGFWEKRGFGVSSDPLPNGYGPEAVLMLRR